MLPGAKTALSFRSQTYYFFMLVSWADLIAVAGAEAVALCGGPEIPVRLGRLDSRCNIVRYIQFIYIIRFHPI